MTAAVRRLFDGFVDLLLPRRCVVCARPGAWLCGLCAPSLRSDDGPTCAQCGAETRRPSSTCPECDGRELAFATAVSAYRYEGPARSLVTACKFRAFRSLTTEMAQLAQARFDHLIAALGGPNSVAFVTCVPVHDERRLERGFDQAELLARELSAAAGVPFAAALARRRKGQRQSGLSAAARAANVAGAYRVDERVLARALSRADGRVLRRTAPGAVGAADRLSEERATVVERGAKRPERGKLDRVVIIDDVYTTGETLNQCSLELRAAGLTPHAFTFARAPRGRFAQGCAERTSKEQSR
jgi:predicted amidophosphoribosyltransferase